MLINGNELVIEKIDLGSVQATINGRFDTTYRAGDEDESWISANAILVKIAGCRKLKGQAVVANVTNSEICDLARFIENIAY
jgi:hypothetical protein